ncbi:NAD(P)/FAD-dependent oxidoreductase [Runella rosea]|uniref:NAD(P)/FAD-dependent oxidoreductase n=1 Tax=Runella rosea TaxID=2259595 RepID=A0A344TMX4_9BACT|nr:FAD/NAD(P)-binding oxidoreductase [Runella rosea]AXE19995.1 NAD(P)/FAD-dependent oxidoreductase [Runella rosea]
MHIIIVGNGIAGITAARHIRKNSDARITVISKETDHFFSRTALMYVYMGHQKYEHLKPYEDWFWAKNRIELVRGTVESIDFGKKSIHLSPDSYQVNYKPSLWERMTKVAPKQTTQQVISSAELTYDKLILATGSVPRMGDWEGRALEGIQGLYSYQDLELLEKNTPNLTKAVIAGGGLIGVELAEMLHTRHIPVTILVREKSYWNGVLPNEESALVTQHLQKHGLDLRFNTEIKEIKGQKRVEGVETNKGETIECQLVGLTIGVTPNVSFLASGSSPLKIKRGIIVNEYLETNLPDVYAIGDCVEHQTPLERRKPIEQIWYTGRIMGETVAQTICGKRTAYRPGVFFNSAKFFDLEYQTYGDVPSKLPEGINTFYWQHPDKEVAIRINYRIEGEAVTGFNALGTRLRHAVCEAWIKEKKTIDYVLKNFQQANFDPEFFEKYELPSLSL